jgi:IS30 family transposase
VDTGKGFLDHQSVAHILVIHTGCAVPYCSGQHGSKKDFNRFLHQSTSDKRRLETVTREALKMVLDCLKHRPKKRLGF